MREDLSGIKLLLFDNITLHKFVPFAALERYITLTLNYNLLTIGKIRKSFPIYLNSNGK